MQKQFTTTAPKGYKGQLIATVTTERNYWSVTGEISTERERQEGDGQAFGCIHEEIISAFPHLQPFVDLHLSTLDGAQMHTEANGWYWLAGAAGGLGEKFHGANASNPRGKTLEETLAKCRDTLASHLRISIPEADHLVMQAKAGVLTKEDFSAYVNEQKPRWKAESESALALLQTL